MIKFQSTQKPPINQSDMKIDNEGDEQQGGNLPGTTEQQLNRSFQPNMSKYSQGESSEKHNESSLMQFISS